jgi:threonylcarbamoyladenosine tRNA methylthiotransferase CDKAL1
MIEDIEDCAGAGHAHPSPRRAVLPRALRPRRRRTPEEAPQSDSFIPGTQSVYLKTWGCSHNTSDGEYMAGMLAAAGYTITDSPLSADLWLLNSCTVKGPAEDGLKNAIRKGRELGKSLVVSGCVPQGQRSHTDILGLSVVGVQQIDRVVEVVEETLKGNTVRLYGERRVNGQKVGGAPLDLPKIRKNRLIEIIPINTGCLNQCTYCKTKHARGDLGSYPPHQVVERAKQAFQEGVVELWLTSEDLGAYGHDIGVTLPELLWQLVRVVPEGCMVRLGMTNPPYIMDHMTVGGDSTTQLYSVLDVGVCRRWRPYCVILTSIRSSTSLCSAAAILSSLK